MLETISEYIDVRLLIIILIALFSFVILKFIYKKISMNKMLQVLLTIIVLSGNIYSIYTYVNTLESEYIDTKHEYYIKGEVKFVSDAIDKLRIEYTDTNIVIRDLDSKDILVGTKSSTGIYDKSGKKINLNEFKKGDFVYIKTNTNSLSNGTKEIIANTIQKK